MQGVYWARIEFLFRQEEMAVVSRAMTRGATALTLWDLFRATVRFWPVSLVGILMTAGAGLLVLRDPGVYWTRVDVQFLAPTSQVNPNSLRTTSEDIIITAGAVARKLNGPGQLPKYGSVDVTLVGLGVREGWYVRLPDTGGQWAPNFASQVLVVEVVNPDRERLQRQLAEVLARVDSELNTLQHDLGAAPVDRITTMPVPASPPIYRVGGNRTRALGMTAFLGGAATTVAVAILERWRSRRA